MRKTDVIDHFGSAAAVAKALDISRAAVFKWPETIPEGSAYKIESVTGGAMKVDPSLYPTRSKLDSNIAAAAT